jgi:hypothetical protein
MLSLPLTFTSSLEVTGLGTGRACLEARLCYPTGRNDGREPELSTAREIIWIFGEVASEMKYYPT